MLKTLEQWYCDVCGEVIQKPDDGYVVWHSERPISGSAHGFLVIHRRRCDDKSRGASAPVTDFLGDVGVSRLLSFVSLGPMHLTRRPDQSVCRVRDLDEFADLFRRLQVPYYEEARRLLALPEVREWYSDHNEIALYQPETLRGMIEDYGGERS